VTRPPFSIVVLSRAQREIEDADLWWSENRDNRDAIRDEFRKFCELVAVFPDIGTRIASSRPLRAESCFPTSTTTCTTASGHACIASRC
jgi:hypothetical protein